MMLETTAEVTGFGSRNWKLLDTLGRPWISLPEGLRADLMVWRWLLGIGEHIHRKAKAN